MKLFKTVSIVIPAYNEIKTITKLIKNIKTVDLSSIRFKKEIIVINDGSTDGTKSALAKIKGIKVLNTNMFCKPEHITQAIFYLQF